MSPKTDQISEPPDQSQKGHAGQPPGRTRWRLVGLAVLVIALLTAGIVFRENIRDVLTAVLQWTRDMGVLGAVVFGVAYALVTVLMMPGSILTMGAGLLFGVLWGTVTVSIASTTGAALAFLVGRFFARDWVAAKVAGRPRFQAIDRAVGQQGFKIVLLTRLSPIFPFNLLNYAYGLTGVKFWSYVLASWIGMLPGTLMYVYFGSLARNVAAVAAGREKTTVDYVFYGIGLVVTVAVVVLVTRVAGNALKSELPPAPDSARQEQHHD